MASTPRDRFDDIPTDLTRVGAHRAPAKRGRGWIRFAWAVLATGALVVGGLYGLSRVFPSISFDLPGGAAGPEVTATPVPVITPITDPALVPDDVELSLTVLNASANSGVQDAARDQLIAAGWPEPAATVASERDRETTFIYYDNLALQPVAMGLAELLGVDPANVGLSDAFPGATVTIVLGADYTPPAG